mgnify:FL=1
MVNGRGGGTKTEPDGSRWPTIVESILATPPVLFGVNATRSSDFAVLFDMDGVILQDRGADPIIHQRAFEDLQAKRDLEVPQDYREPLETYEYTDAFVDACAAIDVDPEEFFAARETRSAKRSIERLKSGHRSLYPDVSSIPAVSGEFPTGIVSNNYHPTVKFVVEHFDLGPFEHVRGRDIGLTGYTRRKPDPHYLEEALNTLGVSGGVYVGDRITDVQAAHRAGLESVLVRREHVGTIEDVEPSAIIDQLNDLSTVIDEFGT